MNPFKRDDFKEMGCCIVPNVPPEMVIMLFELHCLYW